LEQKDVTISKGSAKIRRCPHEELKSWKATFVSLIEISTKAESTRDSIWCADEPGKPKQRAALTSHAFTLLFRFSA